MVKWWWWKWAIISKTNINTAFHIHNKLRLTAIKILNYSLNLLSSHSSSSVLVFLLFFSTYPAPPNISFTWKFLFLFKILENSLPCVTLPRLLSLAPNLLVRTWKVPIVDWCVPILDYYNIVICLIFCSSYLLKNKFYLFFIPVF